jgi:hypothetical protein
MEQEAIMQFIPSSRSLLTRALVSTALFTGLVAPAFAGGVVVCNNCASPAQAARQGGAGNVFVPDFHKKELWAFENDFDRETRRYMTIPVSVPPALAASYFRVVSIPTPAKANIIVRQDGTGNNAGMFPEGFDNANAALVAGDTNLQNALGTALAANYVGADLGSTTLNDLAFEVIALGLDFTGAAIGFDAVTITLVWKDGGKTVMKMKGDNITQAEYVKGASYDADGNKLPDSSAVSSGDGYVGGYRFRDTTSVEDWVNAAAQYGIPIHGGHTNRMTCSWDGRRLVCHFY